MLRLRTELKVRKNEVKSFPLIANKQQGANEFNWNHVLGYFIKYCFRNELAKGNVDEFTYACKLAFEAKLDVPEFWRQIEEMYFRNEELFTISPELLLFKASNAKTKSPDSRMGRFFLNLLQDFYLKEKPQTKLNFIEKEIVTTFNSYVVKGTQSGTITEESNEEPFLPFITKQFAIDLAFLNTKPKYFLNSLIDFLRLYAFLYTTQLSINLGTWRLGEPSAKKCYFIMDHERASEERTWVKDFGYKQLNRNFDKVFPYLAMAESLQESESTKLPLWKVAEHLRLDETRLTDLNAYIVSFAEDRGLAIDETEPKNSLDALEKLLELSRRQFGKAETRHDVNVKYKKDIEAEICGHFIQNRGRAGRVLVFNQDYIMLLTNLAIGNGREQLRFHELVLEFEARGVFFDKQSQKVLVDFYERIGNVQRMSDSGDAVYVRKTV
jgi:DNA phosphorothioation-dependent restriction protein DptG